MPWNNSFLNIAFNNKFRLINYPDCLAPVGTIGGTLNPRSIMG